MGDRGRGPSQSFTHRQGAGQGSLQAIMEHSGRMKCLERTKASEVVQQQLQIAGESVRSFYYSYSTIVPYHSTAPSPATCHGVAILSKWTETFSFDRRQYNVQLLDINLNVPIGLNDILCSILPFGQTKTNQVQSKAYLAIPMT